MGGLGYATQSVLYLGALTYADASLVALLFCLYPLMVMVLAIVLRTDRPSVRRGVALVVALVGVSLVLGGAGSGGIDPVGSLLALASAAVYTTYILIGDRLATINHLAFATLVCTGAFLTFSVAGLVRGMPDFSFEPRGWLWLTLIALVSTVASIGLFFAGLARVGATVASLLSIIEPVVTVASAALVFGESLSALQVLGAALVLATVLVAQLPSRGSRGRPTTAADEPALAAAH
jgi:drug/metabolite transporter (DMT)-like permease